MGVWGGCEESVLEACPENRMTFAEEECGASLRRCNCGGSNDQGNDIVRVDEYCK